MKPEEVWGTGWSTQALSYDMLLKFQGFGFPKIHKPRFCFPKQSFGLPHFGEKIKGTVLCKLILTSAGDTEHDTGKKHVLSRALACMCMYQQLTITQGDLF